MIDDRNILLCLHDHLFEFSSFLLQFYIFKTIQEIQKDRCRIMFNFMRETIRKFRNADEINLNLNWFITENLELK